MAAALIGAIVIEATAPESHHDTIVGYLEAAEKGDELAAAAVVCESSQGYVLGPSWQQDLADVATTFGRVRGFSIKRGDDELAVFDVLLGESTHATSLEIKRDGSDPCLVVPKGHPLGFLV